MFLENQLNEKEKELDTSLTFEEQEAQRMASEIQTLTDTLTARDCEIQRLQSIIATLQKEADIEHEKVKNSDKISKETSAAYNLVEEEKRNIQHENELATAERDKQYTAFISLQSEIEMVKVDNNVFFMREMKICWPLKTCTSD